MTEPKAPAVAEAPAEPPSAADAWAGILHVSTAITIDAAIAGLTIRELFRLERGSIVATEHSVESNVPVRAGGALIAWGEFQVIGERLAVRVAELA